MAEGRLQIGELARRAGVKPSLIRAWEQRYGLLEPARSAGGTRLYSMSDLARLRAMVEQRNQGFPASQAAISALAGLSVPVTPPARLEAVEPGDRGDGASSELGHESQALASAFARLDPDGAQRSLDALLAGFRFETVVRRVVLPYLRDVGSRWARGETSIAEEHFASSILRARFHQMTASAGVVPPAHRAVLACPPDERHDLSLVIFGASLARQGWQVSILGADTPIDALALAVRETGAQTIVVSAVFPDTLAAVLESLRGLAGSSRLLLAGPAVSAEMVAAGEMEWLDSDPIVAADQLSAGTAGALSQPATNRS